MDNKPAGAGATGHFGRQMRKERVARGWTLQELVRDTTNRDGGTLAFGASAWERFTASLR